MKMIDYLYELGRNDDALELARRCSVHDHSKLETEEIECFIKLPNDKGLDKHSGVLTDEQKKLISIHWKKNRHHPEYFEDYHQMSEIDVLEMCCDWSARSKQFKTQLIPFVINNQRKRFNFDDEWFDKIIHYCTVLSDQ
jgi:hypothetical protein